MNRETIQLWLTDGADADAFERKIYQSLNVVGVRHHLGRNMVGFFGGGDYTLDLFWQADIDHDLFSEIPDIKKLDRVVYSTIGQGCRTNAKENTIWRTLLLSVKPDIDSAIVERFETDLLAMPEYIEGIRSWMLSRVRKDLSGQSAWTHVWQQEYQHIDDLMGEYLMHPYHWGWVDHYFDADFPDCVVAPQICHVYCPLQRSLIDLC